MTQIINNGHVVNSHRAYLGVQIGDTNGSGVYIQSITPGGPAAKAGLEPGDVITSVNGHATADGRRPDERRLGDQAGNDRPLEIVTQSGEHKTLHLTLGEFPGSS